MVAQDFILEFSATGFMLASGAIAANKFDSGMILTMIVALAGTLLIIWIIQCVRAKWQESRLSSMRSLHVSAFELFHRNDLDDGKNHGPKDIARHAKRWDDDFAVVYDRIESFAQRKLNLHDRELLLKVHESTIPYDSLGAYSQRFSNEQNVKLKLLGGMLIQLEKFISEESTH